MWLKLGSGGPLHRRIDRALRGAILEGRLGAGARLPSTRALAADLDVSRNSVLAAYEQLLAEGYLEVRAGSGTFVAEAVSASATPAESAQAVREAQPRLSRTARRLLDARPLPAPGGTHGRRGLRYDFQYGLPAIADFPHESWRRLLGRRARRASLQSLGYGPPQGEPALREALAGYLARARGVQCSADQLLIVNGSQQALDLLARVLLDPGDRVVIEEPCYQGARQVFLAAGAGLVPLRVDADGLDPAPLFARRVRARLAYLTPSHQFPSGGVMPLPRRLELLRWAESAEAWLVEDDYDSEFRYAGRPVESLQGLDGAGRVLYVGTCSKVLFPALRLGYLVLPRRLLPAFSAAKWLADRHAPTLEQRVLADFIHEGQFERHLRRVRARCAARRAALLAALAELPRGRVEVSGASAGIHLLLWLCRRSAREVPTILEEAARRSVGLYPVAPYYLRPARRAGLLLGYASLDENEIRAGIRRVADLL